MEGSAVLLTLSFYKAVVFKGIQLHSIVDDKLDRKSWQKTSISDCAILFIVSSDERSWIFYEIFLGWEELHWSSTTHCTAWHHRGTICWLKMSQLRRLTNTKQKSRKSRWIIGKLKIIHNSNMKLNFPIFFIPALIFAFFMLWGNIIRILSHADCETSKRSSQDKKKEEPPKRVRVLCWIMTHPANHKTRVRVKSWLFHYHQNIHVKNFVIWILWTGSACEGDLGSTMWQTSVLQLKRRQGGQENTNQGLTK